MSRKLSVATILFLSLLCACASGGFTTHPDQIPTKLAFTVEPGTAIEGVTMSLVAVTVQDVFGNTVSSARTNVTVAIGSNPVGGTLSGTDLRDAINKQPLAGAADLLPAKRAAEEAASFGPPVVRKMPAPESKGRIGFEQLTKIVGATSDLLSERTCRRTGTYLDPEFPHRHSSTASSTLAP